MCASEDSARYAVITRRQFNLQIPLASTLFAVAHRPNADTGSRIPVALTKGMDRKLAIGTVIQSLGEMDCQGKDIYLKGNFNSADPYPASTHLEALSSVVQVLREKNCGRLVLAERSGMGQTREIWQKLGVPDVAKRLDLTLLALEDLAPADWRREELPGSHWKRGVEVPRFLREDVIFVQICNLKTHRFGGQFSASLKNSIGLIAKHSLADPPHNYMAELHDSPDQRLMIAEVNQVYKPMLVVMDAAQIFIDGGPEVGEVVSPGVLAACRDRVALDATALALLRLEGVKPPLSRIPIFEQEQIKRAVELELGAGSGEEIHFITRDPASSLLALQISAMLSQKPEDDRKKP